MHRLEASGSSQRLAFFKQMAACEGWLASASRDRSVRLWHTREQEFVAAHTLPAAAAVVSGVDFIAGAPLYRAGHSASRNVFNILSCSSPGRKDYLSSGSRDGTVCFWDTSRPSAPLNSTSLAQNTVEQQKQQETGGQQLLPFSQIDGLFPLSSFLAGQVTSIRHVPQSNCVLQASEDKTLRVWIREGNVLHQFPRQSNILVGCDVGAGQPLC